MRIQSGYLGLAAKMVLRELRGATPEAMKKYAMKMDDSSQWLDRIDDLVDALSSCDPMAIFSNDWAGLPGGGHVRRNHICSQNR